MSTPPPATNVSTTGELGGPPVSLGTQYTDANNKLTTEIGGGGSTTAQPDPPGINQGAPVTNLPYGSNQPSAFTPTSTLLSGTMSTFYGYAGNTTQQAYRAPNTAGVPATNYQTTGQLGYTAPVPQTDYAWVANGTLQTAYLGAPGGQIVTQADTLTINHTTPAVATQTGVIGSTITVVDHGQIIAVTGESQTIHTASTFTLTHSGVTSTASQLVVKNGSTTLTLGTDYTATATGSAGTANFNIEAVVGSPNVSDGATVTVGYSYGNAAYFTPVTLVASTDYTATFSGNDVHRTLSILRVNSSTASADGDSIVVTYTYGNQQYWATNDPTSVPPVPTIGTALVEDRAIAVQWTITLGATDDVDGFIIMSSTGGTRYVPGEYREYLFRQVVPSQAYTFQVAAFNEAGVSAFSSASNTVTPLNYDETPTGSLDPRNTVNPIYSIDGSIVAGTGLGPSGIIPGSVGFDE